MKNKISVVLLVAMLMLFTVVPVASATTFTDVPESHWAFLPISIMSSANIVEGIGNGMFGPENEVSGEEFTAMAVRSLGSNLVDKYQAQADASDWAAPYLAAAEDCDLLNNLFVSNKPMSRTDMAIMIYNYIIYRLDNQLLPEEYKPFTLPIDEELTKVKIPDIGDLTADQQKCIKTVYSLGCLRGVDSFGNFKPNETLTRAQAAHVLNVTSELFSLDSSHLPEDVRFIYNMGRDNVEWVQIQLAKIITEKMTEKEKAAAIAYYLCDYMTYDMDYYLKDTPRKVTIAKGAPSISEPYGVCDDYAKKYHAFCLLAGLECEYVSGTARGLGGIGGHAWNRVKCDGDWYYVDVTWLDDDDGTEYDTVYLLQKDYWTTHKTTDGRYGTLYVDGYKENIYNMSELLSRCTIYEINSPTEEITVHVGDVFDFATDKKYHIRSIGNTACVTHVGDVTTKDGLLRPCYIAKAAGQSDIRMYESDSANNDRENPDIHIVINVVE